MGNRLIAPLLILASSCSIPDEVGLGGSTSQYDFLGASGQWPLTNDRGESYGISAWATWRLTPVETRVVMPRPEWIGDIRSRDGASVTNFTMKDNVGNSTIGDVADATKKVAETVKGDDGLQWLTALGLVCLAFFLWLKYGKRPKLTKGD